MLDSLFFLPFNFKSRKYRDKQSLTSSMFWAPVELFFCSFMFPWRRHVLSVSCLRVQTCRLLSRWVKLCTIAPLAPIKPLLIEIKKILTQWLLLTFFLLSIAVPSWYFLFSYSYYMLIIHRISFCCETLCFMSLEKKPQTFVCIVCRIFKNIPAPLLPVP